MKITRMTMAYAEFILQNIMGLKVYDLSLSLLEKDEVKIGFHYAGETKNSYVNIRNDGRVTLLVPTGHVSPSHEFSPINSLPITDYLIAEGFKFEYELPLK